MKLTVGGYTDDAPVWIYFFVRFVVPYVAAFIILGIALLFTWGMAALLDSSFTSMAPYGLGAWIVGDAVDGVRRRIENE